MDLILEMMMGDGGAKFLGGMALFGTFLMIFSIAVGWKIFVKAGFKGYESIIPMHNFVVMLQIAGKPISYFFLFLIPIANVYFLIKVAHGISKSFGKGALFTVGLIFLPILFFPILAFGKSEYIPAKNLEFETVDNFSFKEEENKDELEVEVVDTADSTSEVVQETESTVAEESQVAETPLAPVLMAPVVDDIIVPVASPEETNAEVDLAAAHE